MAKNTAVSVMGLLVRIIFRGILLIACLVILYMAAGSAFKAGYGIFKLEPMAKSPGEDIVVTVQDNMSARSVGRLLEEKGLIKDANIYWVQSYVYEYKPLPGTYLLNNSETLSEMMEIMMNPASSTEENKNE